MSETILSVEDLRVTIHAAKRRLTPVDGISLSVERGEALGIVGESGSGKSLTLRAILGLLPASASISGDVRVGEDSSSVASQGPTVRDRVSMIFQEPMTALNPTMRVGDLVAEGVRANGRVSGRAARNHAVEILRRSGVPDPEERARMWPHQLSGGLRQRVMIAAALSSEPALLLCDEPTTALDVPVQDEILTLLRGLRDELETAVVFVSHDLAVVAEVCDRVAVMYAGRIVEIATTDEVLTAPRHPYTAALIASAPALHDRSQRLTGISGTPPGPGDFPDGCRFAPRCAYARDDCHDVPQQLLARPERLTACIHPEVLEGPSR